MSYLYIYNVIFGVFISIIFFIISYRRSIGAKKERINSTYKEIVRILIKNLINDDYIFSNSEINRILQAKALENKININDLPDEETFLNSIYTKIAEDEIIASDRRRELLEKINKHIDIIHRREEPISLIKDKLTEVNEQKYRFILAIISISVAVASVIIISLFTRFPISVKSISITIAIISLVMFLLSYFFRLKEKQEEPQPSRRSKLREHFIFRYRILKILRSIAETSRHYELKKNDRIGIFDFLVKKEKEIYLVQTKFRTTYFRDFNIKRLKNQAKFAKESNKKYITILVVNDKKYLGEYLKSYPKRGIMYLMRMN